MLSHKLGERQVSAGSFRCPNVVSCAPQVAFRSCNGLGPLKLGLCNFKTKEAGLGLCVVKPVMAAQPSRIYLFAKFHRHEDV
jgi:hypothetical protein